MYNTVIYDQYLFDVPIGEVDVLLYDEIKKRDVYRINNFSGELIIDIGANIGIFSIFASEKAKKVIAYEPEQDNYEFLLKNIHKNKITNIETHKLGLGKKGKARIIPMQSGSYVGELGKEPVKLISLNDIKFDKCDLMKIDCEGSEFDLIKYAKSKTLKKIKRISMEIHKNMVDQRRVKELIEKLSKYFDIEENDGQMLWATLKE